MKTKLLLNCTAILLIAMITVPVMAAPPNPIPPTTTANPVNDILIVVKDIQIKVGTILANLTSLQMTTNTIKTTTDSLLQAPPEPTRYEYYTGTMVRLKETVYTDAYFENWGDSPADVCEYHYLLSVYDPPWTDAYYRCFTLGPEIGTNSGVSITVTPDDYYKMKVTTNSKYVAISEQFKFASGDLYEEYLPGDFHRVEIYS